MYTCALMHCWGSCQPSDCHTDTPMVHVVSKRGFGEDGHVVWAFVWALLTS